MGAALLAQLLPIDPQVAIDATKALADEFRRDFIIGATIVFVLQNVAWTFMHWRLIAKLNAVQESRVQDHKDGERRAEKLVDRMAVHMDRSTETNQTTNAILLGMKRGGE